MGKISAVVLAAGKGTRMLSDRNKPFLNIRNKPILYYTLKVFEDNPFVDEIVLVSACNEVECCKEEIVDKYGITKVTKIVEGGKERQNSVLNGLKVLKNCDIVLLHDGARPFIDDRIINEGIRYAKIYGGSACGVTPKDTIKVKDSNGFSSNTLDRSTLFNVQTPQCFKYDIIFDSHKKLDKEGIKVTDDTMVAEHYGHKVYLYEGSYNNIKITTPEDLVIAEMILENLNLCYDIDIKEISSYNACKNNLILKKKLIPRFDEE